MVNFGRLCVQSFLFANYHKQRRLFLSSTFSSVRLPTTTPMSTAIKASITADVGVASSVVATSVAVNGTAEFVTVSEGTANMQYDAKEAVFYNKVMTFNRDFSIQVIRLFAEVMAKERSDKYEEKMNKYKEGKSEIDREPFAPPDGISILDALAATGLRSVRFMKEIPGIKHLTINDLLPQATDVAAANCKLNGVDASKITISNGDATMLMFQRRAPVNQFDVIDLDPYGSAAPFLDSAVQAVSHGGLLCVTCTDMPVLTGSFPEVCYAKYGSIPLKASYLHEMSLRILLHSIDAAANKYKRHIVPWVSLSVDYYVRVFVRVYEAPAEVKNSCLKRCHVYQSTQCPSFYTQPLAVMTPYKKAPAPGSANVGNYQTPALTVPGVCPETGGRLKIGGPFWSDVLHSQVVVDELLRRVESCEVGTKDLPFAVPTGPRMIGVLTSIAEELKDVPFYFSLPELASCLSVQTPTNIEFKSALMNAGFRVSGFHHDSTAMKTDAPVSAVWDIMRAYSLLHPPLGSSKKKQAPSAAKILSNPSTLTPPVDFTFNDQAILKKVARFPPNPEANWGPKRGAGRLLKDEVKAQKKAAAAVTEAAAFDLSASASASVSKAEPNRDAEEEENDEVVAMKRARK